MTNVSVTKGIQVAANAAWEKLSSFRGIEDYSPIAKSITEGSGVGATRSCFMPDNAEIKEELTKFDSDAMFFEYKILSGPFPISNYVSTVKVNALSNDSCEVVWSCSFESGADVEEDMKGLFGGFYNVIIENLESHILQKS